MVNFNTPILFLVFNRPDTTIKVLQAISKIQPKYLYVASDGPRPEVQGEKEKCDLVRKIIEDNIDWDCDVKKLDRSRNLGCGRAVSNAITWFFSNVERGIILEDDCVPNNSFFAFSEAMLELYNDNEKIYAITGQNLQYGNHRGNGSFYFSKYLLIWGWATWRRAWDHYDFEMKSWPEFKKNKLNLIFPNDTEQISYWDRVLSSFYRGEVDSWDYQFLLTIWQDSGLTIVPNKNLVSNIGFRSDATHTIYDHSKLANMVTEEIDTIVIPSSPSMDRLADDFFYYNLLHPPKEPKTYLKNFERLKKKLQSLKHRLLTIIVIIYAK
jgi:hypothetical protein